MAKKETFLLVSLEEEKATQLAQVISNVTCRKILDELSKGSRTETQLAQDLNSPISTVHYNLKNLVEAKLVEATEYHYSEKGKEVNHYTLANKFVIIAPKKVDDSLREKLKRIIPTIMGVGLIGFVYSLFSKIGKTATSEISEPVLMKSTVVADAIPEAGNEIALQAASAPAAQSSLSITTSILQNWYIWLAIGAISAIAIYILTDYIIKKMKR